MRRKYFLLLGLTILLFPSYSQVIPQYLSLQETINNAKSMSTASKIAQSIKENKYFQFLSYKAGLRPQLALNGNVADYSKDYFGVVQPDGTLIFQPRAQNYSSLGLSLSQQIGMTGGTIAVNSSLVRFDDFDRHERQYSGIPVNVSLLQPLFGFNGYKWDKKIEPLKYDEAEKGYLKDNEDIAFKSMSLFFNSLDAQVDLELAKKNLAGQKIILDIENKRVNLGTTSKDKILQIQLQLLKSTQELAQAEVNFKTSLFDLKSFTGMSPSGRITLFLPETLPKLKIDIETALNAARRNRAEFVSFQRRKLEAQRDLQLAKKERFTVTLVAAYGYNNVGTQVSSVYRNPNTQQSLNLGVQIPILDWGRTKGKISFANSNLKTIQYTIEQEEIVFAQEITNLVENLKLIADNIEISKMADDLAQERYMLNSDQFRFGKISITDLNIALTEKDLARRAYVKALRTFWESYYQLRLLTLIDL